MKRLRDFFKYFKNNKKAVYKYTCFSFLVGILELFGVALTYPFIIKLLSGSTCKEWWQSPFIIGICIVFLFLLKNIFMIFYSYLQAKFTKNVEAEINLAFMQYFLYSPYQQSSKIPLAQKENILGFLIPNVINNYLLRLLNLDVNFFIFGLISFFLIIKFPIATVITLLFATVLIGVQNGIFKPRLKEITQKLSETSSLYNQRENEAILNIKGVKISNNENFFFDNYKFAIYKFFKIGQETLFLNTIPPYITEPFIILLLFILLAVISVENASNPDKLVASFAVIVSAIFRLSPTISRIQVNLNGINSVLPLVDEFLKLCKDFNISEVNKLVNLQQKEFNKFNKSIELKNIDFEYQKNKPVLKNINLIINKGEFIGIAGLSGAGKTTLIDIIAGLYKPTAGSLLVDGIVPAKPLKIGYIPQEFSVINGSIKDNVIFGFGSGENNDKDVIEALQKAQLYDFIKQNYKEGIYANPFIDSTGLSHGQKQRLAIARALYSDPDILILDEATSSLDLKTEEEICNVLKNLKGKKTIIAIAHRLSTIKFADHIIFMKETKISDSGSFEELINKNNEFKELVKLASLNKQQ